MGAIILFVITIVWFLLSEHKGNIRDWQYGQISRGTEHITARRIVY